MNLEVEGAVNATSLAAEVGARLRERRTERGETLRDVAAAADVSPSHLGEIETGQVSCSLPVLLRLARALDYPMGALLPRIGPHRVRQGRLANESGVVARLSHDELDLHVEGLRLAAGQAHRIELGGVDALVHVIDGRCTLDIGKHEVSLATGDAANVRRCDHLVISASDRVEVLVVCAGTPTDL
ncbi:MAG: helix-turn-helix domain-containing protein [Actinomycetota bacterium]